MSSSLEVRQARWHPGSPNDAHLLVLTSDNALRLYSTAAEPEVALLQTWPLGRGPLGGAAPSARLALLAGLGETAVDFDFAPAVKVGGAGADKDAVEWPIMVLRGNGDVYSVSAPLFGKSDAPSRAAVRGPLTMYPPADDNYGADACSVLVLQSSPPLLVVATCAGTLYHCLLLSPEDEGEDEGVGDGAALRNLSLADEDASPGRRGASKVWSSARNSDLSGQPVLHVFECVELELGLSLDDNLLEDASFNCPLHLQRHPTANDRYLVSHEAGIHILFLPVVSQLSKFVDSAEDVVNSSLPKFDSQSNSVAEYLLCTRVCGTTNRQPSSERAVPSPILGLALSSSPATLIALLAGGEIVSLLLSSLHLPSASSQSLLALGNQVELRKLNEEPFDEYIRKLLKHGGTVPLFKFDEKTMSDPQEAFKLINRVTQLLYENYFQRHEQAHEDIENRMKRLQKIKTLQLADLSSLEKERAELKSKSEVLVDKLNVLKNKQDVLSDRSERVLRNASLKQSVVSDAEIQMRKELISKESKLEEIKENLDRIKKYSIEQKTLVDRWNLSQKKKVVAISDDNRNVIKNNLKQMGQELKTLTSKVRISQAELGI